MPTINLEDLDDDELQAELDRRAAANGGGNRDDARRGYEERNRRRRNDDSDDLKATNAKLERELAIERLLPQLGAKGPVRAFLDTYKGELNKDAVREAIAKAEDWKGAIELPADPRDEAAGEQARHAAATRGALAGGGEKPVEPVGAGLERLRRAYETPATATAKT